MKRKRKSLMSGHGIAVRTKPVDWNAIERYWFRYIAKQNLCALAVSTVGTLVLGEQSTAGRVLVVLGFIGIASSFAYGCGLYMGVNRPRTLVMTIGCCVVFAALVATQW